MSEYGSQDWFERQYSASASDPWGLNWRPTQLYRYGRMLEELRQHLPPANGTEPGLAVDVGCATGEFTNLLAHSIAAGRTFRVIGMDLANKAVERARERYRDSGIEFRAGDIAAAGHDLIGRADIVSCLEVIYYQKPEERAAWVAQLKSMLKPGGLLLISSMIGRPPYLDQPQLLELVRQQLVPVGGGALSLWPLANMEKLSMKLGPRLRPTAPGRYLPGQSGFAKVDRLARLCRSVFGTRADSHTYLLARA